MTDYSALSVYAYHPPVASGGLPVSGGIPHANVPYHASPVVAGRANVGVSTQRYPTARPVGPGRPAPPSGIQNVPAYSPIGPVANPVAISTRGGIPNYFSGYRAE